MKTNYDSIESFIQQILIYLKKFIEEFYKKVLINNKNFVKMFVAVTIENSLENIVVGIKWLKQICLADSANDGVNPAQSHLLFYSVDKTKHANFELPLRVYFDPNADGCYLARINKHFGKNKKKKHFPQAKRNLTSN